MKQVVLLMWSGGVDSTALLYMLAEEGWKNVHAHHVIHKDHRNRWGMEEAACRNIRAYFRERYGADAIRFSESVIDTHYPGPCNIGVHDIYVSAFAAAGYVQCDPSVSRVWIGLHHDEIGDPTKPAWDRHLKIQSLFRVLVERTRPDFHEIEFPLKTFTKEQVVKSVPDDLLMLTYSCQRFFMSDNVWCGECATCKSLNRMEKGSKRWHIRASSGIT